MIATINEINFILVRANSIIRISGTTEKLAHMIPKKSVHLFSINLILSQISWDRAWRWEFFLMCLCFLCLSFLVTKLWISWSKNHNPASPIAAPKRHNPMIKNVFTLWSKRFAIWAATSGVNHRVIRVPNETESNKIMKFEINMKKIDNHKNECIQIHYIDVYSSCQISFNANLPLTPPLSRRDIYDDRILRDYRYLRIRLFFIKRRLWADFSNFHYLHLSNQKHVFW